MKHQLLDLAARVETAPGPNRELDAEIAVALRWTTTERGTILPDWADKNFPVWRVARAGCAEVVHDDETGGLNWKVPCFTGSLDTALTLVPEERHHWEILLAARDRQVSMRPSTAPLPLDEYTRFVCAAALRARAEMEEDDEG